MLGQSAHVAAHYLLPSHRIPTLSSAQHLLELLPSLRVLCQSVQVVAQHILQLLVVKAVRVNLGGLPLAPLVPQDTYYRRHFVPAVQASPGDVERLVT